MEIDRTGKWRLVYLQCLGNVHRQMRSGPGHFHLFLEKVSWITRLCLVFQDEFIESDPCQINSAKHSYLPYLFYNICHYGVYLDGHK